MSYIETIAPIIVKNAHNLLPSVSIAQAVLESGYGESGLSKLYNNHFGMKASPSWKGKVTQQKTQEDDGTGRLYNITAGFKWYDSIDDSVKDHEAMFNTDFSKQFYKKVLEAKDYKSQAQALQGTYATDSRYANKLIKIIEQNNLTKYDKKDDDKVVVTATTILNAAKKYLGVVQGSSSHKYIINKYNSVKPLPVGYAVSYNDDWCDAFVSFIGIITGATDLIGRECGVDRHIQIFRAKGIWYENGTITPKAGDIITFNWNKNTQPNDGFADHIGFVEYVSGGYVHTIEGNSGRQVARRSYVVGHGNIRGYARPKYGNNSGNTNKTPTKKQNNVKTVTVLKHATAWSKTSGGAKMADFVKGGTFEVVQERAIKQSRSNREYLIKNKGVILGWVLSQDIKGGYGSEVKVTTKATKKKKTNNEIAIEVIAGKWGSGADRKAKLKKAGYDANTIQKLVNKKLNVKTPKIQASSKRTVGSQGVYQRVAARTSAKATVLLGAGATYDFKGYVIGQNVSGNNIWFVGKNSGQYCWSGGFTNKSTNGLKKL